MRRAKSLSKTDKKKHFDNRYVLFVLESTETKNSVSDEPVGAVAAAKEVSDNELLNLIEILLGTILKNGHPKLMILNCLMNMLNGG